MADRKIIPDGWRMRLMRPAATRAHWGKQGNAGEGRSASRKRPRFQGEPVMGLRVGKCSYLCTAAARPNSASVFSALVM
jgi:hypothetical protein